MIRTLFLTATLFVYSPVYAQDHTDHTEHDANKIDHHETHDEEHNDHHGHDHNGNDHAAMGDDESMPNIKSSDDATIPSTKIETKAKPVLFITPEIEAGLIAGGEPVLVEVLGVVCDFCAKAMNKTFSRREEVAATYVDLDSKTLSLVLVTPGSLTTKEIEKLVVKSGYKPKSVYRGDAIARGEINASNPS